MYEITIDNAMEWITGSKQGSVTFSQKKWVNKIEKYARDYPDDIQILERNADGSIFAHVPASWFKLSPPRKGRDISEEEREAAAERLRMGREKKRQDGDNS